jgi:transcriptional regulator with XRE-family HTH domain
MSMRTDAAVTARVGKLLAAARVRANLRQWQLAERAGTSQQWVSRVERGEVDLRLGDADRLFSAVGVRLLVQTAPRSAGDDADPDLLSEAAAATELAGFLAEHEFLWRRFAGVPHLLGGRLAALAQGLPVRPLRIDLIVAEPGLDAADTAMSRLSVLRWSDAHQDWTGYDYAVSGDGPRRWRVTTGFELRVEVVPVLPPGLVVTAGGRELRVVPLVRLLADDPDVSGPADRMAG